MARTTISSLQAQIEEKDQKIGLLTSLLDEAQRKNFELREKLRLLGLIVRDAESES